MYPLPLINFPQVVDTGGGNLIAVFESSYKGLFTVNYVRSPDDGRTWSNRTRLYTPRDYNNSAGAPQIIKVGEVLVCSFMTDEDSGLHHWFDGANAKIVISTDKGVTWSVSQPACKFYFPPESISYMRRRRHMVVRAVY